MSWQAQTAVTHYSQQDRLATFRLLMYLADKADAAGVVDPAPSQATLAEFMDCTDRTVRNYLDALLVSGELQQTRIGSGPGRPSAYQICLPMAEKEPPKVENEADNLSARVTALEEKVEKVIQILSTFGPEKVEKNGPKAEKVENLEAKGGKGGKERWKGFQSEGADDPYSDPSFDPSERNARETVHTSSAAAEWQNAIDAMLEALAMVTNTDSGIRKNRDRLYGEALALVEAGYTAEQVIAAFTLGGYWYVASYGRDGQRPKLGNIRTEIKQAVEWDGSIPKPAIHKNGRHPPALPEWTANIEPDERGIY